MTMEFAHLQITFDERVLRPRGWTQLQSRWAADLLEGAPPGPFLELCSGAGHIGLLAADLSGRDLVAVDLDPVACAFMRRNAEAAGLAGRVEVRQGELARALRPDEQFSLIVADPPWVLSRDVEAFPEDPTLAIDGGSDGLSVTRSILRACRQRLPVGGSLLIQLKDAEQARSVGAEATELGWHPGECRQGERGVVQQLLWQP